MTDEKKRYEGLNLFQRIVEIRKNLSYLQKDATISFGSNNSYKGVSAEAVFSAFREECNKWNLVLWCEKSEIGTEFFPAGKGVLLTTVTDLWVLRCADAPYVDRGGQQVIHSDYILTLTSHGHGSDTQDKAAGKAQTYSTKYAIVTHLLQIPTGEDTDRIHSSQLEQEAEEHFVQPEIHPKLINLLDRLKGSIVGISEEPVEETPVGIEKKLPSLNAENAGLRKRYLASENLSQQDKENIKKIPSDDIFDKAKNSLAEKRSYVLALLELEKTAGSSISEQEIEIKRKEYREKTKQELKGMLEEIAQGLPEK
jgi:hypothetical protein